MASQPKGRSEPFLLIHVGNAGHGIMKENRHFSSRTGDRRDVICMDRTMACFCATACCQPEEPGRTLAERCILLRRYGALASVLEGWIVTLYESGQIDAAVERLLRIVQRGCSWMSYYGLPYAFLCFGATYTHRVYLPPLCGDCRMFAAVLPVSMLALPIADETPVHFSILAFWAIPYIIIGVLLLVTKRSVHPSERRAHMVLMAAVIPVMLIALMMNFVLPLFGLFGMWRYNVWPIAIAFVIFIIALFNFGFLGVQLLIERRQINFSLRAITSGTAMLNHAIKNDIGKIKLFSDKINRAAEARRSFSEDIRVIASATSHIESMIRSVHERTQELRLLPQRVNLASLVRDQLQALEPRLSGGQIGCSC